MNVGGGEAADQLMRMVLSGAEVSIRLGGSLLKNLLALTMALAKADKKVYGKISLAKMLKQTRDIRVFPMTKAQCKAFKKLAKKYGILFSAIADKDGKNRMYDLILPPSELDRANQIFERILYNPELGRESPEPPGDERKHWWQKVADRVRNHFRRRERPEPPERSPEAAPEPPMTVERVTVERVVENPTFPEPEIVYALPEQVFVTPEITPDPAARPFAPPAAEATRQEVIETTATVLPLEAEPEPMTPPIAVPVPMGAAERPSPEAPPTSVPVPDGTAERLSPEAPPTSVPVPDGTAERPSPEAPPREADAAPPPKSQGGDTPSRPDSPTTSGKSTPGTQNTNPERVSVMRRLDFFRAEIARRGAPQKEQSKGAEKGAANPVAGKGRAPDGQFPKPKAPAKGVKIPKAPVR